MSKAAGKRHEKRRGRGTEEGADMAVKFHKMEIENPRISEYIRVYPGISE